MDASRKALVAQLDEATAALLDTVAGLSDSDVRQPSLLPGWSCERVLAHLAQNAVAFGELLSGRPMPEQLEPAGGRPAAELAADLRITAAGFRDLVVRLGDDGWDAPVPLPGGRPVTAGDVLVRRLVEVELHHVDLGAGYRPDDWPTTFNELELTDPMRAWRADRLV